MYNMRSCEWLHEELVRGGGGGEGGEGGGEDEERVLVLDCRLQSEFASGHIRGAINVTLPSLLLRRLAAHKLSIGALIKCNESRERFARHWKTHTIVLCAESGHDGGWSPSSPATLAHPTAEGAVTPPNNVTLPTLYTKLQQDGCRVVYLEGGYMCFREKFPEWCHSYSDEQMDSEGPIIGLQNLRISPTPAPGFLLGGGGGGRCGGGSNSSDTSGDSSLHSPSSSSSSFSPEDLYDSCLDLAADGSSPHSGGGGGGGGGSLLMPPHAHHPGGGGGGIAALGTPFPVEILPNLYLGNSRNSADLESLERHRIRYILNVTPDLPNIFERDPHIKYLQIPISDHPSQNLATFFPEAIAFIDEARQKQLGVLVHCLAGVSRSVTITVAYLMHKFSMPLKDAYEFVKQRKANISPNFSFMGQLLDFERELNLQNPASRMMTMMMTTSSSSSSSTASSNINCPMIPCPCPPDAPCTCNSGTTPDSGIDMGHWV